MRFCEHISRVTEKIDSVAAVVKMDRLSERQVKQTQNRVTPISNRINTDSPCTGKYNIGRRKSLFVTKEARRQSR